MIPRLEAKARRWRGADGRFMKLGIPVSGWVLVRCEACARPFPTVAGHPSDQVKPGHYFCTEKCWRSGKVAKVVPEAQRDADVVKRYQRGEPLATIQEAHRISTGTLFRILHGHGVSSNRGGCSGPGAL